MHATSVQVRRSHLLFAAIAAGVYAAALVIAGQLRGLERPGAVAIGLTLDIVVVVPLAFYFLVVRRRGWPIVTLAPVVVLSAVAAARILPPDHQQSLRVLETLAVPLELGLVSWIAWRAARAFRKARRDATADPLAQLRLAALGLLRNDRAAAIFASEIAVFYYALGSWRARPHAPAGMSPFTQHRRSGQAGIVLAFLLVISAEGFAVHMLVLGWSAVAAWIFTTLTAYSALWLFADYRATVLRPILVSDESVHVRAGLRWTLRVPREQVAAVERKKPELGKECLNLTLLGSPSHWIILSEPALAHGPYGLRRRVRALGIEPDAPEEFTRVLGPQPV